MTATQGDNAALRVRIQALGGYRIFLDGRDLRLRTRKEATLLLRLVVAGDAGASRDECVGLLWPDSSEARARHSLSEALRGIELATGLEVGRTPDRLALPSTAVSFDVRELDDAIATGDVHECARLHAGGFLAGWYPPTAEASHWVDGLAASIATRLERMLRRESATRRQATDSRGVTAAVGLLEVLGVATAEDHEAQAEADQVTAWEGLRPGETLQSTIPPDREGPFVGRAEEMKLLTGELEAATKGELRVVLVSGEAGIGKTRTCQRLARLAALRGARLLLTKCYELEQSVAYGALSDAFSGVVTATDLAGLKPVWRSAIADVLPDMTAYQPPEESRSRRDRASGEAHLLQATSSLVELLCRDRPGVLVLDDAQWADATSTRVIHHICRRCKPASGLLVVIATRPFESESNSPFHILLRDLPARRIELGSLSLGETKEQVRRLCGELPASVLDGIARRSGGNPLFARELAVGGRLSKDPPPTIREAVGNRVANLPPSLQNVVSLLAVAGGRTHIDSLSAVLGVSATELLGSLVRLRALRLIREEGPLLSLDHDLVRESIYSSLGEAARAACHKALAQADSHLSSAARARHFELAGLNREAAAAALEGAVDAEARFATREQLDLLDRALRNCAAEDRPHIAEKLCVACIECGQFGRLVAALRPDEDLPPVVRIKRDLASLKRRTLKSFSSPEEAAAIAADLLRRAAIESPADFVEIARERLRHAQEANDVPSVHRAIRELTEFAGNADNAVIAAEALCVAAYQRAYYAPGPDVEKSFAEALEIGVAERDPRLIVRARQGLGVCCVIDGRTRDFAHHVREGFLVARRHGLLIDELRAAAMLACVALDTGHPRRAISHARAVRRKADIADQWNPLMLSHLTAAASWLEIGQPEETIAQAREVLALEREHPDWLARVNAHALEGIASLRLGRVEEARASRAAVEELAPDLPNWMDDPTPPLELVAGCATVGQGLESALRLAEAVAAGCEGRNRIGYWGAELIANSLRLRTRRPLDVGRLTTIRREALAAGNMLVVQRVDGILPQLAVGA